MSEELAPTFEITGRWERRYRGWRTRIGLGVSFERRNMGTTVGDSRQIRHYDFSAQLLVWNGNIVVVRRRG